MLNWLRDQWWRFLGFILQEYFHYQCSRALDLPPDKCREWITRCRWDAQKLPRELSDVIDRELRWAEWALG